MSKKIPPPQFIDEAQPYSIPEVCAIKRQCRAQTYKDLAAGRLVSFKKGRRRYCLGSAIIASIAAEASAQS